MRSFRYALDGVRSVALREPNFRVHLAAGAGAVVAGWLAALSGAEMAVLALTIALVLTAEALNTAIEAAVDLASPEWHPLAQRAKDAAAAGVLLAAVGAVGVGVALFGPRLAGLR